MKVNLELRKLEKHCKDRSYFEAINEEAFPDIERMSMEDMFTFAENTDGAVLGIYDGNEPVGFTLLVKNEVCAYLFFLAINTNKRSKGYGSAALQKIFSEYEELQVILDFEVLDPEADNYAQRARRKEFYLRNGFCETGNYTMLRGERFEVVCNGEALEREGFLRLIHVIHENCPDFPDVLF